MRRLADGLIPTDAVNAPEAHRNRDLWRVERCTLSKATSRTIDEIGLVICPAVDGAKGAPSVFDSSDKDAGAPALVRSMTLETSRVLEGGAVWLRYRLESG